MKVAAISDTHLFHDFEIPEADVLIHAGDACIHGRRYEFEMAMKWLGRQPHLTKLYVPGNHDRFAFDLSGLASEICRDNGIEMLIDRKITVNGVYFFGSPWTRKFGYTQSYMYDPEHEYEIWSELRKVSELDVLITHCPPAKILDGCPDPVGSPILRELISRIRPRYHIFGHVHAHYGKKATLFWGNGRETTLANVARLDTVNTPHNEPVFTFEISVV